MIELGLWAIVVIACGFGCWVGGAFADFWGYDMKQHQLKTWPEYFGPLKDGRKNFEIRKNDRGFEVGDVLILKEFYPQTQTYSGAVVKREVTYITSFAQLPGHVVMSLK